MERSLQAVNRHHFEKCFPELILGCRISVISYFRAGKFCLQNHKKTEEPQLIFNRCSMLAARHFTCAEDFSYMMEFMMFLQL